MRKYFKGRDSGYVFYFVCALSLGGLWQATESIKGVMNELPIQELPRARSTVSVADVRALRGVSEKSPTALKQLRSQTARIDANDVDVDAAFGDKTEQVAPPPSPKFEFDKFFKENASVSAVASNGAVINGHFYELGTDMEMLAIVGEQGNKVTPKLRSVSDLGVVVSLGKKEVRLALLNGAPL
jgi:hypothetical protein